MTAGPALLEFDLAIRSRIEIGAPPAVVWSQLGRLQGWKDSVVSVERIAGEPDAEGETLRIGQRPVDTTVYTIMRTVRIEPEAWKVQTLQTEDGRVTEGYVAYTLESVGARRTRLGCEVMARCRVLPPDGVAGDASPTGFARAVNESTRAKLDADHAALRRLVESGRA
jgi:Polyketide cyclase / dehydrase and lipid transport